jgi:hypothetical protein
VVSLTNHRVGFVAAGCLALTGLAAQYALRDRIARPATAGTWSRSG